MTLVWFVVFGYLPLGVIISGMARRFNRVWESGLDLPVWQQVVFWPLFLIIPPFLLLSAFFGSIIEYILTGFLSMLEKGSDWVAGEYREIDPEIKSGGEGNTP